MLEAIVVGDSIPIIRAISTNCHHSMSVDRPSGFDPLRKFGSEFSMTGVAHLKLHFSYPTFRQFAGTNSAGPV